MPVRSRVRGTLRALLGRGPVQQDLDEEVRGYFQMIVDEKIAAGLPLDRARREAQLEMGGAEQVKEEVRAGRPAAWLDHLLRDVRFSLRLLAKTPAFSLTAVLVLALGIGANSAVFTLLNLLLFQSPPGADKPGTVVSLHVHDPAKADSYRPFTYAEYETIREQSRLFRQIMAHQMTYVSVTDEGETGRHQAALVTDTYFETLGVGVIAGRGFSGEEARPGSGAAVLVLSYTAWQRMGGRADVLGRTLLVNARPFTVIGVAPERFAGPVRMVGPDFWMPLGAADLLRGRASVERAAASAWDLELMVVGRLNPRVTLDAANAALSTLAANLRSSRSAGEGTQRLTAALPTGLGQGNAPPDSVAKDLAVPFAALLGAALVVLLVASLNVANMQLARGASRRKEIAMRLALGAGRVAVLRQLLVEGLLLALAGGTAGLLLAVWAMGVAVASLEPLMDKTVSVTVTPDWRACLAALLFCGVAAVASSLAPAWKLSRLDPLPEMRSQDGTGTESGLRRFGTRNLLVACQVALSLALMAASGLFVRAAIVSGRADPGYRFDHQFLVRVDTTSGDYDAASGQEALGRLLAHVRAMPGVESAALASWVAFSNESSTRRVWRPDSGAPPDPGGPRGVGARSYAIGAAYFGTLGLSMLRGREFTEAEAQDPNVADVAVIDEPLAAALFPGQDPLGQLIQVTDRGVRTLRVIGLAPGLRDRLADPRAVSHIYLPMGSRYPAVAHIHVRTARGADADQMRLSLRDAARAADTRLAVLWVRTLEDARDASSQAWIIRSAGRTFGAFGAISLFMATIGLYGVKAYLVSRRTREIGIRMALGAQAADVVRMVVRDGAVLLVASLVAGFALALGAGQAVSSLLVGVSPFDPLVMVTAAAVLSAAVLGACYVPARRATRVLPLTALRVE